MHAISCTSAVVLAVSLGVSVAGISPSTPTACFSAQNLTAFVTAISRRAGHGQIRSLR